MKHPERALAHGTVMAIGERNVFVVDTGAGAAVPIVVLHGFPGSSHDWRHVLPLITTDRRVIAFDFPGYGRSSKAPEHSYSLFAQADLVESLLAALGIPRCVLVAHDMGDTVAAELLARSNEGRLGFEVEAAMLTNGSIFIDMVGLTRGQRLGLALPNRRLPFDMPRWVLHRSLLESFATPPPDGEVPAMVEQIRIGGGARMIPVLIRYIEERRVHQSRWTAGLVDFSGPLTAVWGELDTIAVPGMVHRLAALRPGTEIVVWPDVGHWPSIEQPARLAEAIRRL
jgi:pimeloyl-ACP methyl ester carboxylesterase